MHQLRVCACVCHLTCAIFPSAAHGHGATPGGRQEPEAEAAPHGGGRAAILDHQRRRRGGAAHVRGGRGEDVRPRVALPSRRGLQRHSDREAVAAGKSLNVTQTQIRNNETER